jgi:ArsR family transcriptional regulator
MNQKELSIKIAEILKNIANPIRLQCLCCLVDERKNVSQLLERIDISQSALSQHLILLKDKGIVKDEKVGKFIYYSIADEQTVEILGFLKKICDKGIDN